MQYSCAYVEFIYGCYVCLITYFDIQLKASGQPDHRSRVRLPIRLIRNGVISPN